MLIKRRRESWFCIACVVYAVARTDNRERASVVSGCIARVSTLVEPSCCFADSLGVRSERCRPKIRSPPNTDQFTFRSSGLCMESGWVLLNAQYTRETEAWREPWCREPKKIRLFAGRCCVVAMLASRSITRNSGFLSDRSPRTDSCGGTAVYEHE